MLRLWFNNDRLEAYIGFCLKSLSLSIEVQASLSLSLSLSLSANFYVIHKQ